MAITNVADQRCPELLGKARETAAKFRTVLGLFSKCHQIYSSQHHLSDDDITSLGKKDPWCNVVVYDVPFLVCLESTIQEFFTFYRSNFPAAKITPTGGSCL